MQKNKTEIVKTYEFIHPLSSTHCLVTDNTLVFGSLSHVPDDWDVRVPTD